MARGEEEGASWAEGMEQRERMAAWAEAERERLEDVDLQRAVAEGQVDLAEEEVERQEEAVARAEQVAEEWRRRLGRQSTEDTQRWLREIRLRSRAEVTAEFAERAAAAAEKRAAAAKRKAVAARAAAAAALGNVIVLD